MPIILAISTTAGIGIVFFLLCVFDTFAINTISGEEDTFMAAIATASVVILNIAAILLAITVVQEVVRLLLAAG